MTTSTTLPNIFTTLADTDELLVNSGGKTGRITVANAKKVFGGGTASTGTTGATNLFSTPKDLGQGSGKFVEYDTNAPALARPGGLTVTNGATDGTHIMYEEILNAKLIPGSYYTVGATVTRTAGSGTGKVRAHTDFVGSSTQLNAADQTVTDGVAYRTALTFQVPANNGSASHVGFDFTPGSGTFTFSNVTLVAGQTDNPNAT